MAPDDARTELASIAASLRAYLEWHQEAGTVGFPRAPKQAGSRAVAAVPAASAEVRLESRFESPPHVHDARDVHAGPAPQVADVAHVAHVTPVTSVTPVTPGAPVTPVTPIASRPPSSAPALAPSVSSARAPISPIAPASPPTSRAATPAGEIPHAPEARAARLTLLRDEVAGCARCELAATRTNTVFSRGNPDSALCFIGEAPGADEDAQGVPFVGRAGQLLDRMIGAMGLDPERDVYVCNIIKCRPPANRTPTPEESDTCIPYLHEQIALVKPKVIVALGNTAVASLLGTNLGITKMRGQWKLYKGKTLVMPTYHPSYLLRPSGQQAEAKRQAWEDLQTVMKELGLALPAPKRG